jgi:predicted metalloprotease with PDZ domain
MLAHVLLLAAAAAAPQAESRSTADTVRYSAALLVEGDSLRAIRVEVAFHGDSSGVTRIWIPSRWAGSSDLWMHIGAIEVDGADSVATRHDEPAVRVIAHRPGAPLVARYLVSSAYDSDPGFGFEKARPTLRRGWFLIHGEGVFATPEGRGHAPASFRWSGVPAGWRVASDLDHIASGRPATVDDVVESVAVGSPQLAIVQRIIGGVPLRVAVHGEWDFSSEELAEVVERIVAGSHGFWRDSAGPFLVTVSAVGGEGPRRSMWGTGRGDAFSIASTPGFTLSGARRFLAHEYQHSWFPRLLGGSAERDEAAGYWFSEGFTDYVAARTLLAAGLWTLSDYAADLNAVLLRHAASPARRATSAEIIEKFWSDRAVERVPYDRGYLLAHFLDERIRAHTGGAMGVRDVVLAQRDEAAHRSGDSRIAAADLFIAVLRSHAGLDLRAVISRYVDGGEELDLPSELLGGCIVIDWATTTVGGREIRHQRATPGIRGQREVCDLR